MRKFRTVVIFPDGFAEGRYEFEAPAAFLSGPPARIVDTFLTSVDGVFPSGPGRGVDINYSVNHRDSGAVTASGCLARQDGGTMPFVLMISEVRADV